MPMPGILQQIARSNPMMQSVRQMIGMVNNAQNPQAMLNQLLMTNPQMKQIADIANSYGGDYKKAFYAIAEQKGIDPNEILDMVK